MVDILVKDNKLYVASQYDKNLLQFMRSRQKRFWNTNTKKWEIPESELNNLIEVLQGYEYNIRYDGEQTESHTVLERSEKLPIKNCVPDWYEYKTKPYQHQVDGISYGLMHDNFLLADEQGCIDGDMEVEAITEYGHFKGFLRDLFHMFIASLDKDKYKILCYIGGCLMDYYPLEKVLYSGEKECYGLQLEDGSYIIGTPDHEILTNKGYISLMDVISPDFNTYVYKQDEEVPTYTKLVKADCLYYVGTKSVYDIVMKDPFRNFVANNIVAHNCGKTKQILDLSQIRKKQNNIKHVLIVPCVNGLKYNWFEEVKTHTNDKAFILGTRYTKNGERIGSNEDRLADINSIGKGGIIDDCYYLITNIETLRYNKVIKVPLKTKKNGVQRYKKQTIFPIIDAIQQQIRDENIGMVVIDEAHKCKDPNSLQGRALISLNCDYKVALTGTPVMNNPVDVYTILHWLGFEEHSLFAFKQHYCIFGGFGNHQIVGYKNLPELQGVLDKCMLRRLKSEVLDLPEKIYINDFVEMTAQQTKLYNEVKENIIQNIDKIKLSPNPLVQLIRLRQVTGNPNLLSSKSTTNPKFDRMLELIEDVVINGNKCIVYSNWTDVLIPAYELAKEKKYCPALYTGQNKDDREEEKKRFMEDEKCKVIFGTMDAMGTGLTLTAANTVIFLDEPWNRAKKDQCEDRVHRIGTKQSPNIITIMCRGTIDERIHDIVYKKGKMSDILIDKEEDILKNPKLVNYLLSID